MPEYIDRKKFMDKLREKMPYLYATVGEIAYGMDEEDVVRVVRCKDCEYYSRECMSPGIGWCECLERGEYDMHFCNYGDRKESEGEGE